MEAFTIAVGADALDDLRQPLYDTDEVFVLAESAGIEFTATEMVVPHDQRALNVALWYVACRASLIAECAEYEVPYIVDMIGAEGDAEGDLDEMAGGDGKFLGQFFELYRTLIDLGAVVVEGFEGDVDGDWSEAQ